MESEALGHEEESLSENAETAEDSQWVRPLKRCVLSAAMRSYAALFHPSRG